MSRTIAGIVIGLTFLGFVVYTAMSELGTRCEVCMSVNGRTICEAARASDESTAIMQAQSSACSRLTSGVTQVIRCGNMQPASIDCGG
jgi:hypothetical protein